ncbi:hypothetical protein SRM1_02786 [Pseudomonas fluorescens]|nr:hypothetical protein SRM1_02786 [Pseudomonas fluorescens]
MFQAITWHPPVSSPLAFGESVLQWTVTLIQIDKPVTFLLPFDRYSLTLSHRLLDSMGGVSRFLLRAIEQELSLAALIEVTALSESVLLNQLAYLQAHRYVQIEEGENGPLLWLTARGTSIVQVEHLLEDFSLTVWLDAFTLSRHAAHFVMFDDGTTNPQTLPANDAPSTVVTNVPRRTGRAGRSRLFDDANRLRGLLEQDGLKQLLEYCWGADCELITSELEHWAFELGMDEGEQAGLQVPIEYAAGELQLRLKTSNHHGKSDALPSLTLPVVEIAHVFKPIANFPWTVELPSTRVQRLELVSSGTLSHFTTAAVVESEDARHARLPMCLGDGLPSELDSLTVAPGLCVETDARILQLLCSMDEVQLARHLQRTPDAFTLSHNLMTEEAAELA